MRRERQRIDDREVGRQQADEPDEEDRRQLRHGRRPRVRRCPPGPRPAGSRGCVTERSATPRRMSVEASTVRWKPMATASTRPCWRESVLGSSGSGRRGRPALRDLVRRYAGSPRRQRRCRRGGATVRTTVSPASRAQVAERPVRPSTAAGCRRTPGTLAVDGQDEVAASRRRWGSPCLAGADRARRRRGPPPAAGEPGGHGRRSRTSFATGSARPGR